MADLLELSEQERWLLFEYGDVEGEFPQLIYDLHFAFPGLSIGEKYRLAQELIAGVVEKGMMEVVRIAYEEDPEDCLSPVSVTPVPLDELRRVWDHPLVWDPARVDTAPELLGLGEGSPERLAIAPTALGETVLDEWYRNRAPGLGRIDVVVDVSTLHRSEMGSVTAEIFLRGPAESFPDDRWSDFPVVILGWWIEGLARVASGELRSYEGRFMDGPYSFVVKRGAGDDVRLAWGRDEELAPVGMIDLPAFLQSSIAAGRTVAEACHARGWESRDLELLEGAIGRGAV